MNERRRQITLINDTQISAFKNASDLNTWNYQVKDLGMEIDSAIGKVQFLNRCFIRKGPGVHMVLRGKKGAVNVLIMEGEYVPERIATGNESLDWVLIPCPIGSMAIIGKKFEALDQIEQLLDSNIHWRYKH